MRLIIVGGGFGGLKLARKLAGVQGIEILLLDRINYHQFQPLFYQVATSGLDASNISFPLRKVFQRVDNIHFRLGTLQQVKDAENKIITDIGEFDYDVLVLATGADTNFFGNEKIKEAALPMKSTAQALVLKYHLIENFEDAVLIKDEKELEKRMTVVLVGGGPTGVELSGAIAEMRKYILPKDYPELDFKKMKIYLIEGSKQTLSSMSDKSSEQSEEYLKKLGVIVKTSSVVKDYDGDVVTLASGETIAANTVIWSAGIKGNLPEGINTDLVVKGNRVKVDRYNKIVNSENIYAIGDIAYMETEKFPKGHPQLANVAINQGKVLAENLAHQVNGNKHLQKEFEYDDKGTLATVGRNLAVADLKPNLHFGGWIAWFIWMSVHLTLILGVKNKLQIFINWLYKYFTYDQDLRLLIKNAYKPDKNDLHHSN